MGYFQGRDQSDTAAANSIVPVVSGNNIPATRCLMVGSAGTADIVTANGETLLAFPLQDGYNPISVTKVTLGTAASVYALY